MYLQKVASAHPDKGGSSEEFQQIKAAYQLLLDKEPSQNLPEKPQTAIYIPEPCSLKDSEYIDMQRSIAADFFFQAVKQLENGELCHLLLLYAMHPRSKHCHAGADLRQSAKVAHTSLLSFLFLKLALVASPS